MRPRTGVGLVGCLVALLAGGFLAATPARYALASERSLEELLRQLQIAETLSERLQAAEAIAEYGPAVVPRLLPLLNHPDQRTQEYACLALVRLGPEAEAAIPALIRHAARRDCHFRSTAIFALQQIGPSAAPAIPLLISILTDQDGSCREAATDALAAMGQAAVPALIATLREPDPGRRRAACLPLQQLGILAAPAIPALTEAAAEPNEPLRDQVFLAFTAIGGDAVGSLIQLLDSPDSGLRRRAAMTLGRLRRTAHQAETALGPRTQDTDPSVRFWAVRSLPAIGGSSAATRQYLLRAVRDDDPNVRWQAITSLGALDTELAKQAAADLLNDPNPAVRKQAQAVAEVVAGAARP